MNYDGPGVGPAVIAQKARDLQMKLYERRAHHTEWGARSSDFDALVDVVTALAEATQWMIEQLPRKSSRLVECPTCPGMMTCSKCNMWWTLVEDGNVQRYVPVSKETG
jgi:hypothetical protein